jgi:hypothetical protein
VPLRSAFHAFVDFDPTNSEHLVVRDLRLPRTVVGLLAGAALGLAGGVMQGLARNPLADPGILGVNSGAALFVAEPTKEYSMEQVGVLAQTDVLLVPSTIDGTAEAPENAPLSGSSLWKQLPAVQAGRVFPVLNGAASLGTALELLEVFDTKVLAKLAG